MTLQTDTPDELSDAELDRLQREADGEVVDTAEPTATDTPDAEVLETVADGLGEKTEETPTDATPDPVTDKVAGVASKDGSRVLPYAALQSERRARAHATGRAARAEEELAAARQQIADLKAGKTDPAELSEEDVAQMESDFPDQGAKLRAVFNQNKELKAKVPTSTRTEEVDEDDPTQEAIDQVPLLVEWQHQDVEKFERAQAIDQVLEGSPKWKNKPVVERFAQVAKLVAEEYDIPYEEPQQATKPSTSPASNGTKKAIESASRTTPNTLSDFKGGAVPNSDKVNFERLTPAVMLSRFADMTDAEMDAHLAKLA